MALRTPSLQCVASIAAPLRAPQRRWANVRDIRFVTQQASERISERYKEKLEQKRKQVGASSINDLKDKYKDKIHELKKNASTPEADALSAAMSQVAEQGQQGQNQSSPWPKPPPPPKPQFKTDVPKDFGKGAGVKTLSSFLDVDKTKTLPQREVEALWKLRFANNPASISASVPAGTWKNIHKTARKHPLFILPGLPRKNAVLPDSPEQAKELPSEGAPIHFMQWQFTSPTTATVMFTHLGEYKIRGEYAQPHTTLTHHFDLLNSHGLVLCEGVVIEDRTVSIDEAKWLILNMQKFYNLGDEVEPEASSSIGKELKQRRRELVEKFSSGSPDFRVEDLLEEAERMG